MLQKVHYENCICDNVSGIVEQAITFILFTSVIMPNSCHSPVIFCIHLFSLSFRFSFFLLFLYSRRACYPCFRWHSFFGYTAPSWLSFHLFFSRQNMILHVNDYVQKLVVLIYQYIHNIHILYIIFNINYMSSVACAHTFAASTSGSLFFVWMCVL